MIERHSPHSIKLNMDLCTGCDVCVKVCPREAIQINTSVVWRGPMLFMAIDQFLYDVNWGYLEYLVIDLPPGTGDVQLTLAQRIPITGVIMVSTPQKIALSDVQKAVDMFERLNIPILGLIENMTYLCNPVNGERIQLIRKVHCLVNWGFRCYRDRQQIKVQLSVVSFLICASI